MRPRSLRDEMRNGTEELEKGVSKWGMKRLIYLSNLWCNPKSCHACVDLKRKLFYQQEAGEVGELNPVWFSQIQLSGAAWCAGGVANTTTCCLLLPTTEEDDEECDIVSNFVFFFLQNRKRDENVWLPSGLDLITHIALRWEELSNHLHTCLGNNGTMSVFPEMLPYSRRYPLMPRQFGIIHRIRVQSVCLLLVLRLWLWW